VIEPTPEIIRKLETLVNRLEVELKERDGQIALLKANLQEIIEDHAAFTDFVDSKSRHIRKLIITYGKRLQVLEIKQALRGLESPPLLDLEIQEIRTELEQLYRQAKQNQVRTDSLMGKITGGNGFWLGEGGS